MKLKMETFQSIGFQGYDGLIILGIGVAVFALTKYLYRPLISWLEKKNYIGYDIHKSNKPATAESGGLGLTIGMIVGLILVLIFYSSLWENILVFLITVLIAGLIGWIDDRKQLSSIKKIALMFITGLPVFFANLPFVKFIDVPNPVVPILGQLRINIIYPLTLPFIIMIMTNTVNMLEGYNGEGSGTCSIATLFLIIGGIIIQSAQGILFGVVVFASLWAFYLVNKYPAKAFPGDIGTLVVGAALGLIGIMGNLLVIMILVMLPQIFNSFYVIASVRGFKESHTIEKKDIYLDDADLIHPSRQKGAPLTLPRLIVAHGKLDEKHLVHNFMALSTISGGFAIIAAALLPNQKLGSIWLQLICILVGMILITVIIEKFPRVRGLTLIMTILLGVASIFIWIIDQFIIENPLNWLYGGLIGLVILVIWYGASIYYFWFVMKKRNVLPNNQS